ncbi:uncharacterized protein VP01_6520g1, partial [Puccinia sorghi]
MGIDSSDDDHSICTIIHAKGYEDIMDGVWTKTNKNTKNYQKMYAWGIMKLYATVEDDLHPVIISKENKFFDSLNALSVACGEKSIITLFNKLFQLINLIYNPGSSLAQHISIFRKNYTALTTDHPSDTGFIIDEINELPLSFDFLKLGISKNCEICKSCKIKRAPHSNPLPSADQPFKTLHID